jgi:hypothetical protein
MDTALYYLRVHLIRNLKRLRFITTLNFSSPSPSVTHNTSRLYLLLQSSPVMHRRHMKVIISILASHARLKLGCKRICRFVYWTMLSNFSSVMRQLLACEGVGAFLAWPITPGNFVGIFFHLRRMCVQCFTLSHFVLSFPVTTTVSSGHCCATVIIRLRIFYTLRVTFPLFHIISIAFRPVISAVIIADIRQYHCTNTLNILWVTSVPATHNRRHKLRPQ